MIMLPDKTAWCLMTAERKRKKKNSFVSFASQFNTNSREDVGEDIKDWLDGQTVVVIASISLESN